MPYCALSPQLTSARRAGRRERRRRRRRGRGRGKWLQARAAQTSPIAPHHQPPAPLSTTVMNLPADEGRIIAVNFRGATVTMALSCLGPRRRRALLQPAPASPAAAASSSSAAAPASPAFPSLQLFPNSRRKIITHACSHGFDVEWPSECEAKQAGHAGGWPAGR